MSFSIAPEILARIRKDLVKDCHDLVDVREGKDDGKGRGTGTIAFETVRRCLRIHLPETPVKWLDHQKCGDSAIFEFDEGGIHLHLVELKCKVTPKEWHKAKEQFLGAYLNALALKGILDLPRFSGITLHLAYTEDAVSPRQTASPATLKAGLGVRIEDGVADWIARRVAVPGIAGKVPLRLVQRDQQGNGRASLRD